MLVYTSASTNITLRLDHNNRSPPLTAFVQGSQTKEHHQQRQGVQKWGLSPSLALLIREPGPLNSVTFRQLLHQPLHFLHGLTGGDSRSGFALNLHGGYAVVALQAR